MKEPRINKSKVEESKAARMANQNKKSKNVCKCWRCMEQKKSKRNARSKRILPAIHQSNHKDLQEKGLSTVGEAHYNISNRRNMSYEEEENGISTV